jgi:PilZ domain
MADREELILSSGECLGMLRRELPVRLLNFSGSGCLMESERPVEPGTIGTLRLTMGSHEYVDDVRVVRCQAIEGGSIYHLGVQFVWTAPPHARSLRRALSRGGDELSAVLTPIRRM